MQLQEALDRFLVQLQADDRSRHTLAQYRRHVGSFIAWLEPGTRVEDLSHELVARFLVSPETTKRRGGGDRKQTTLNALRSSLRVFFGFVADAGYAPRNHGRLIRRARASSAQPRWLTEAEQERLLDVLKREDADRDYVLFSLLVRMGLRIGEALALETGDVDLERRELRLRRSKGGRTDAAPIPEGLVPDLTSFLAGLSDGSLFKGPTPRPITARHARRRLAHWLERAGLPQVPPHALRHSFARRVYARTRDPFAVKAVMRHGSIASTLVYSQPTAECARSTMEACWS